MTRSVGVVVPAFRPDVERLRAYVRAIHHDIDPAVVRIELDDPEPGVVDALSDLEATVNAVARRRGKGAAITAGFEALSTDVLAFADADGATTAGSFAAVVDRVRAGEVDLAVGSRRHPDATVESHQTVARRYLGDAFAWLARRVVGAGLHDYQCGAKALTAETWAEVREHLTASGFAWDIELIALVATRDRRILEVPVVWDDQPGTTVSTGRTTLALAAGLFRARSRAKALRGSRLHERLAGDRRPLIDDLEVADESVGGDPHP
ncbi:MAG: glycosyltransferase [Halolamina sp.]